ncbi:WD40-repeat-containing domain protein [Scheffersomyces amazonensis]|uniref:WD40-repeat-containing domain protein n=1 Tax=Scheffersomyces amazonensis TaxID=1078765 RepID=UPI00315D5F9C
MASNNSRNNKTFFKNFTPLSVKDAPLPGHSLSSSEIIIISINATGTKLVTSRTDKTIRIWRCYPDKIDDALVIEDAHAKAVESISWEPNTEHSFASVGRDEYVKIWNAHTAQLERQFRVFKGDSNEPTSLKTVRYSSDGLILITVDRESIVSFFSVEHNYKKIYELTSITEPIYDVQWFHYNHSFFILALHNGNIPIYKLTTNEKDGITAQVEFKTEFTGHRSSATGIVIDPRGTYFAVGSGEGVVSIWDTQTMLHTKVISDIDESIACLDASRDGTYIAISYDKSQNIAIYDTVSGDRVFEVPNSESGQMTFSAIEWFPNKTSFAYSSDQGTVLTVMKKPEKVDRNGRNGRRNTAR